ncbi:MAG: hypothetical protein J7M11_05000 [Elusimicrobia bacterium]|nr:hypothetical protein [Elusimicrobiota bacterium]
MAAAGFIKIAPTIILFSLLITHYSSPVSARGLDINVDVIKLRNIAPGVSYSAGKKIARRIIIRNRDVKSRRYSISFHKPSELGVKYNSRRYEEIADVSWLWAGRETMEPGARGIRKSGKYEIEIEANGQKEIFVYLKAPDKKENYGRRFCAVMAVSEVPGKGESNQIVLAVYPRIDIETIKKSGGKNENKQ